MNPNKVGKTILFLRKHYNMTQHELAEKLGVTDKAVSRWENGYGTPDISLLSKLSVVLDIDIESILEGNLSNLDLPWKGMLFLEYSDEVGPLDFIFCTRIVELQLSMFMLAGIQNISIIGCREKVNQVSQVLGDGKEIGCSFEYVECDCSLPDYMEHFISKANKTHCIMGVTGATFIYGKDITKCFRRIINDNKPKTTINSFNAQNSRISFFKKDSYDLCTEMNVFSLDRGCVVFDISSREAILDASNFLSVLSRQMNEKVADLSEIAQRRGFIKTEIKEN